METPKNNTISNPKNKSVMFLTALIVVLTMVLVVIGYLYYDEHVESIEIQQQLNAEKDSIALNLQEIMFEYDVLETDNEALQAKLDEEQEKATKLYDELKQVRQVSYAKIKEYQRELGTLRSIMRDMVVEIDSLNNLNQQLIAENIKVRQEYTMSQKTVESLEQQTQELSTAVEKGSVIKARSINVVALNRRSREITRARNHDTFTSAY